MFIIIVFSSLVGSGLVIGVAKIYRLGGETDSSIR